MGRIDRLSDLADSLQDALNEAPVGVKAQLAAQYRATLAEIDTLTEPEAKAGDPIDEIAARRAARGGATSRLGDAARGAR